MASPISEELDREEIRPMLGVNPRRRYKKRPSCYLWRFKRPDLDASKLVPGDIPASACYVGN